MTIGSVDLTEAVVALKRIVLAEAQCRPLEEVPEEVATGAKIIWRGSTITYLRDLMQAIDRAADRIRSGADSAPQSEERR